MLPFLVVTLPQLSLAAAQHGVSVLAPEITAAAGMAPESIGLIGGLVGLGSVWFFAASGAVIPVLGAVRALTVACFGAVAALALFAFAAPWLIFLAAPFVGFAYAVTAPAGSQILAAHAPRHLWGTLFSLRMAGVPTGGFIAGFAGAGLAAAVAWQAGLAAVALPALLCGVFLIFAAGPLRGARPERRVRLREVLAPANLAKPLRVVLGTPGLALLTFSSLGFAAVQGSTFTFLTTYLTDGLGLSLATAGGLFATMQAASVLGRIGAGVLADRVGSVRVMIVVLGLASATGAVLLAQARGDMSPFLLYGGAVLIGASVATWNGLFLAGMAATAAPDRVSEVTAAATFFTFISYTLTPPLFGRLAVGVGYRGAYLAAALCVLAAAIAVARAEVLLRWQRRRAEEKG
jgi:MFS family permease